jgi:hypothetical protein
MSRNRTKPTESARKRAVFTDPQARGGRSTRAELMPTRPLLEFHLSSGGQLKLPNLFYGGETRAGG